MLKRILTASVLILIVFGTIFGLRLIHPAFVACLVLIAELIATHEMISAFTSLENKPMKCILYPACVLISALSFVCQYIKDINGNYISGYVGIFIALAIMTIAACAVFTFVHKYEIKDLLSTIFIMIYPIAIFASLIVMNNEIYGLYAILLTIIVPVMTDTMAYFTGISIGGKKLCPEISPKKTIAGAIGGVVGAMMGCIIIFLLFDKFQVFASWNYVEKVAVKGSIGLQVTAYLVLGLIAGPVCEIGDLAASWIKRKVGIKDYGKIFPGHGGVMDRIDSILFMIPLTIIFTQFFLEVV